MRAQPIEDGQDECGRLAGAGLGRGEHVATLQHERDRRFLDGCRDFVAFFGHHLDEIGRDAERVEGQAWAPAWVTSRARARERDGGTGFPIVRNGAHRAWAARSIAEIGGAPAH
jgi:hypothetical protein